MRFYLSETLIDCVLQFAVLLELAWSLLRFLHSTLDKRNIWLVGAILLLAGMMLWPWMAAGVPDYFAGQTRVLLHLQFSMSMLRIAFLVAIVAVSQFLAIGWRNRELYVAVGLGFYSICSLAISFLQFHMIDPSRLDFAGLAAYLGVLVFWIMQFWKEPARRATL
jgi:ABC-type thiamin/hydroxymethylpyrimidine transport system permease subunit